MSALNPSSVSLPSRISLWLGVCLVSFGFFKHQPAMTTIGAVLIAIGVLLWVAYKPPAKKPKKPNPMFRFFKQKALQKETQKKETQVKLRQSIKEGAAALEQMRKASNKTNLDKK